MATPSIPNPLPNQIAGGVTMSTDALRRIEMCGFPAASRTALFQVCSVRDIRYTARICTTVTAGTHCDPNARGTRSGATAMRPKSTGSTMAASIVNPFSHTWATRSGLSRIRANAA